MAPGERASSHGQDEIILNFLWNSGRRSTEPNGRHLSHDHVLALLDEFAFGLDDRLQELDVLHVAAVRLDAVDEVLHDPLVDLAAQLEVVHEDVLHRHGLQDLAEGGGGSTGQTPGPSAAGGGAEESPPKTEHGRLHPRRGLPVLAPAAPLPWKPCSPCREHTGGNKLPARS